MQISDWRFLLNECSYLRVFTVLIITFRTMQRVLLSIGNEAKVTQNYSFSMLCFSPLYQCITIEAGAYMPGGDYFIECFVNK